MDIGDHASALGIPRHLYLAVKYIPCFIHTDLKWFDVVTFVHTNNFVLSKELTQETATSYNSKL